MGVTTRLENSSVEGDFKDDLIQKEISSMFVSVAVGGGTHPLRGGQELSSAMIEGRGVKQRGATHLGWQIAADSMQWHAY